MTTDSDNNLVQTRQNSRLGTLCYRRKEKKKKEIKEIILCNITEIKTSQFNASVPFIINKRDSHLRVQYRSEFN